MEYTDVSLQPPIPFQPGSALRPNQERRSTKNGYQARRFLSSRFAFGAALKATLSEDFGIIPGDNPGDLFRVSHFHG